MRVLTIIKKSDGNLGRVSALLVIPDDASDHQIDSMFCEWLRGQSAYWAKKTDAQIKCQANYVWSVVEMDGEVLALSGLALTGAFAARLDAGWKIVPGSCALGGNWVWHRPRGSSAFRSAGCVCHNPPEPGEDLSPVLAPYGGQCRHGVPKGQVCEKCRQSPAPPAGERAKSDDSHFRANCPNCNTELRLYVTGCATPASVSAGDGGASGVPKPTLSEHLFAWELTEYGPVTPGVPWFNEVHKRIVGLENWFTPGLAISNGNRWHARERSINCLTWEECKLGWQGQALVWACPSKHSATPPWDISLEALSEWWQAGEVRKRKPQADDVIEVHHAAEEEGGEA